MPSPTRIARLADKQLADVTLRLMNCLAESQGTLHLFGGTPITVDNAIAEKTFSNKSYTIERAQIHVRNGRKYIDICRGRFLPRESFDRQKFIENRESSIFDEYLISFTDVQFTKDEIFQIEKVLQPHRADSLVERGGEELINDVITTQLEQLRQLAIDFSERQMKAESRQEAAFKKREDALQSRTAAEEEKIAILSQREAEKIDEERRKIEEWRKEINDREPQHERRELRKSLTSDLREAISSETPKSVTKVFNTFNFYFLFSAAFVFLSIWFSQYTVDVPDFVAVSSIIKSTLSGVASAAFAWAGLSGRKAAAHAERAYEQSVRRYAFDMDRASWVVETILQMNTFEQSQIPDEWLRSACSHLFDINSNKEKQPNTSLESFAALFDATAKANIGTNGINFEVDKRGARKLADGA